jgi:hypothetical protein
VVLDGDKGCAAEYRGIWGDETSIAASGAMVLESPAIPSRSSSMLRMFTLPLLTWLVVAAIAFAQSDQMDGYLGVPQKRVDEDFGAGFSMYVAAWPLLETYPGQRFQSGLFGTWMFAKREKGEAKKGSYSDIEGGLGWWRDTRFATETPKFIMGGVALEFSAWANGPGAGKGRDWSKPRGKYAVAQLSPWVLWPPDGLNIAPGTCGELFGYGYHPLPLTDPKPGTEASRDGAATPPVGNQSWTLFLNAKNFKGPVAFFLPGFFAKAVAARPDLYGKMLDSRPTQPNRAVQMETQYIPSVSARDEEGRLWARVAPTRFPADADGESILVHRIASYRHAALWDRVVAGLAKGEMPDPQLDPKHTAVHEFTGKGWSSWTVSIPGQKREDRRRVDWAAFATPFAKDPQTFAYRWRDEHVGRDEKGTLVRLPGYYRLDNEDQGKQARWVPVAADKVPVRKILDAKRLAPKERGPRKPYLTPQDSYWKSPGPVAGPFKAYPGDGSVVSYSWFRFVDQPALRHAGFSAAERKRLQERVELIHRAWTKDRSYLAAPTRGRLAAIDGALIVTPPKGLEVGYVPIVTRQATAPKK